VIKIRKTVLALASLIGLLVFAVAAIQPASAFFDGKLGNGYQALYLWLVEKDPSDWSVVQGGAKGQLFVLYGSYFWFSARGLEPYTKYTLIYYGDETHNDQWPFATCMKSGATNRYGRVGMQGGYNFYQFIGNDVPEKIWLVLSSDVDCDNHKMTAWHPTEYLFEWDTI